MRVGCRKMSWWVFKLGRWNHDWQGKFEDEEIQIRELGLKEGGTCFFGLYF